MTLYVDSSAIVKLVWREPESADLGEALRGAPLSSSELVLAELPRAIWRIAPRLDAKGLRRVLAAMESTLRSLALVSIDRGILALAGGFTEPSLRSLDAIHLATAISVGDVSAFVTYDGRQARVARAAGLEVKQPGR